MAAMGFGAIGIWRFVGDPGPSTRGLLSALLASFALVFVFFWLLRLRNLDARDSFAKHVSTALQALRATMVGWLAGLGWLALAVSAVVSVAAGEPGGLV